MTKTSDVLIIGAGPAALSAAHALAEDDRDVMIVDAGPKVPQKAEFSRRRPLSELRTQSDAWRELLGRDFHQLDNAGEGSPKLRILGADPEAYSARNRITAEEFRVLGLMRAGGLSSVWGAVATCFSAADIADWPVEITELAPGYRAVAERIGISGPPESPNAAGELSFNLQPPLRVGSKAQFLLDRAKRKSLDGFSIGQSWNAVLSEPLADRLACDYGQGCMLGCPSGAIYSSEYDLTSLLRSSPNVGYQPDTLITSLNPLGSDVGWRATGQEVNTGEQIYMESRSVFLAAGAPASTRLGLSALKYYDRPQPFLNTPCFGFAAVIPGLLGEKLDKDGFGMAQLTFSLQLSEQEYVFGALYDAAAFPRSDLARRIPLSRYGASSLLDAIMPGLMVGLVYMSSANSDHEAVLGQDDELRIRRRNVAETSKIVSALFTNLRRSLRALGAYILPGSFCAFPAGTEAHYAGGLPMGTVSSKDGQMMPGLYVIDAASFPSLPAKHHTFTAMANAYRIAKSYSASID